MAVHRRRPGLAMLALATVLTVLGPDAGWEFAREWRIAAVFQGHAGPRRCTPAWLEWQASES